MAQKIVLNSPAPFVVTDTRTVMGAGIFSPPSVASGVQMRRIAPAGSDEVFSAATADVVSATLREQARAGDTYLILSAAASLTEGFALQVYDRQTGERLIVKVRLAGSSDRVELAEPLPCDVSTGSDVFGISLIAVLTSTQVSEVGDGYVLFRIPSPERREWSVPFRVVRRITRIALTPTRLAQTYPVVRQMLSAHDSTMDEAIQAAWDDEVVPLLAARGMLDEDIFDDEVLAPMHALATVRHMAMQWPASSGEFIDRLGTQYEQVKETTFARIDFALRSQQEETPAVVDPGNEQRTGIMRITR